SVELRLNYLSLVTIYSHTRIFWAALLHSHWRLTWMFKFVDLFSSKLLTTIKRLAQARLEFMVSVSKFSL
uniref:Uncharacterized protein n=1 Tax=Aegilops tauschii subsp. strangulata TaxID=200361 RepID=A0A453AZV7_AEGTS